MKSLCSARSSVAQDALVAVDKGDLGFAAAGRGEAGIVGEHVGLGIELPHVEHARPLGAVHDRELPGLAGAVVGEGDAVAARGSDVVHGLSSVFRTARSLSFSCAAA
jgi:hypothetical protein